MHNTRHHRYQHTFIISGALCGLVMGIFRRHTESILVDALSDYLPAMAVLAQILSLVLHTIFSSWRDSLRSQAEEPTIEPIADAAMEKCGDLA